MPVIESTLLSIAADVATAITGVVALGLAYYSINLGRRTLKAQDKHNQLSVKPMPWVSCGDYEDSIYVYIENRGLGPLIINEFEASKGNIVKGDLISHMPEGYSVTWADFVSHINGRVISAGERLCLIRLDLGDSQINHSIFKELCREYLGYIDTYITYTDMYDNSFPKYHRKLDWFHRS